MSSSNINTIQSGYNARKGYLNTISFEDEKSTMRRLNKGQNQMGDFIKGEKLGEGTFAQVYQGTHRITQEKVAIKIMSKEQITDANDNLRIEKEINIQKRLYHSNIIQQYCIIETKKHINIVTEYCSGGELFDYIVSKGKLNENEACKIYQQLIAGLEYLHKQRIVHRDLKPENLLFNSKHELKIADFGLSNEYTGKLQTPCGSPCYAAPEMVVGKKYNGSQVDIWSSGVVLFTMVCGYLPFEDKNQANLFAKISRGIYTVPNHLSSLCKDFIKCILTTDPTKRFTFDQIKHHPWFNNQNNVMGKNIFFHSPGLFVNEDIIPLDESIIKELVTNQKYELKDIIRDVMINKHNEITTSYYLILKRKIRNGEKSISDFSSYSEPFLSYIKSSISKLSYFGNDFHLIIDHYHNRMKHLFKGKNEEEKNDTETLEAQLTLDYKDYCRTQVKEVMKENHNNTIQPVMFTDCNSNSTRGNKKIPTHMTKFINKKNQIQLDNDNTDENESNGNQTLQPKNIYLKTEPCQNTDNILMSNTANYIPKGTNDNYYNKLYNEQVLKKITDKIASIATESNNTHQKKKSLQTECSIPNNEEKISTISDFFDVNHTTPSTIMMTEQDKRQIKTLNIRTITNEKDSIKPPHKQIKQRFLNTSVICDLRNNSPIIPLKTRAPNQYKNKGFVEETRNIRLLRNQNKITHYSQEHNNRGEMEISIRSNYINLYTEMNKALDNPSIKETPQNSYRYHYTNINTVESKQQSSPNNNKPKAKHFITSLPNRKKRKDKQANYISNLNKYVNITPVQRFTNYASISTNANAVNRKSHSIEVQAKRSRFNNYSIPRTSYHKPMTPLKDRDIMNLQNKNYLNIYSKKSSDEIKHAVIDIVGKDVYFVKPNNVSDISLLCNAMIGL